MPTPADLPQVLFLSGNEALAIGAAEAGVTIAAAYPGTPSTEIVQKLGSYPAVHAEWSVNEKVALEVALGGSLAGRPLRKFTTACWLDVASTCASWSLSAANTLKPSIT